MINGEKIIVIVPAYNVENQIKEAVLQIEKSIDHIIIVDDCSKDGTLEEVKKIPDNRIIIIKNESNKGVGGAVKAGFKKALDLKGNILIKYDGDGQMEADKMRDLIEPLFEGYDYAKGNRFLQPIKLQTMPKLRLIGNLILTFFTKLSSGYWHIFDPQNGFTAIRNKALDLLPLHKISNGYFFENDLLIHLNIIGARVKDVNIPARYGNEKSSMSVPQIMFTFPLLLMKSFFYRIYHKYILYDFSIIGLFYFLGLILMVFGSIFGTVGWIESVKTGIVATTGTVMIAVLPIILGFQLVLQAIVLEIQSCDR